MFFKDRLVRSFLCICLLIRKHKNKHLFNLPLDHCKHHVYYLPHTPTQCE